MKQQYIIAFKTDDIEQFNNNHGISVAFEIPTLPNGTTPPNVMKRMFTNLIEELCKDYDNSNATKIGKFQEILTKKDQEHKAELEMIKGEVQKLLETLPELESDEYDAGLLDMKQLVLAILDSHINKL